ncbi:MAG: TonB family protein [Gallionella sp.]|nr:TonB family protein [Gallionella sp.]MDD4957716.1 TonB family protein [Gallionella sp.]
MLKQILARFTAFWSVKSSAILAGAMAFSIAFHSFALFGVGFVLPDPRKNMFSKMQPLKVVLVNSKSNSNPLNADALAQNNLDGGGNTSEDRQAQTALPNLRDDKQLTPEQAVKRQSNNEQETRRLLTQAHSVHQVAQPALQKQPTPTVLSGEDLVQRSLEIARLEAQISRNTEAYQKLPRRKFIGARTQEYRFAQYIEDWRIKVERFGNLNYPAQARRDQIFGKLTLSVSILADGTLEKVEIERSSGKPILDAAAVHIVKFAAPYSPLSPDIRKDTDILTITRTWTFTSSDKLESE